MPVFWKTVEPENGTTNLYSYQELLWGETWAHLSILFFSLGYLSWELSYAFNQIFKKYFVWLFQFFSTPAPGYSAAVYSAITNRNSSWMFFEPQEQ